MSLKRTREPEYTNDNLTEKRIAEPSVDADIDDELDQTSDQNLEAVRRAVAADRGDPDVLPGF